MRHEVSYGIVLLVNHETRPVIPLAVPYGVRLDLGRSQIAVFGCQFRGAEAPAHGMEALRAGAKQSVLTDFHELRKDFSPPAHTQVPRRKREGLTQTVRRMSSK